MPFCASHNDVHSDSAQPHISEIHIVVCIRSGIFGINV